jgi:hypothetical protein
VPGSVFLEFHGKCNLLINVKANLFLIEVFEVDGVTRSFYRQENLPDTYVKRVVSYHGIEVRRIHYQNGRVAQWDPARRVLQFKQHVFAVSQILGDWVLCIQNFGRYLASNTGYVEGSWLALLLLRGALLDRSLVPPQHMQEDDVGKEAVVGGSVNDLEAGADIGRSCVDQ